jgi:hypothetical protein
MLSAKNFRDKNKLGGYKSENTDHQDTKNPWKYYVSITAMLAFDEMSGLHVTARTNHGV